MRQQTSWGRRLRWGLGVMSAVLVGVGAPVAAQTAERAPSPAQDQQPDPQSGAPSENFSGYVGYVGAGGAGAGASAAPTDPDDPKAEPLGPVGTNSGESQDVPGQVPAAEADESTVAAVPIPPAPSPAQTAAVQEAVSETGTARVIVMMHTPVKLEASLSPAEVTEQRADIQESLAGLDSILAGTESQVVTTFEVAPSAVVTVDQAGLDALTANANVAAITLDREFPADLDVSTGILDSDLLNAAGVLGNGFDGSTASPFEVAILDTGVDNQHAAFAGRIVAQACFSASAQCPNGLTQQVGGAAGDNCTFSAQCDHGTHVGGIAAGEAYTGGHEGVARGARLVAMQIGHSSNACQPGEPNPCWRYFFSDLDLALQHTLNLRNGGRNIAAVNMSLGGPLYSPGGPCATDFPTTNMVTSNLAAAGVAVIAAAGNNGSSTQIGHLGCLPNVFAVGATDDADVPAFFTNSSSQMDWWAPGVGINAPITTNSTATGPKSGTSMASPHVVGAFALMRECVDSNGVGLTNANIASDLSNTGVNVTRNGVTRRRINVLDAATSNVNNNDFASPENLNLFGPANGPIDDFDFNVCADSEAGEPGPFSVDNSIWWTWTPATTGTATISTEDDVVAPTHATTFDTTLTVYTGASLGTLSPVAFDDDSGTGLRSLAVFPVQGETTYRIKVDGFAATNGLLNLHVQNGPPPTCQGVAATIVGTINNDVINGTPGNDVIVAGNGNDTINGLAGNDRICGDAGNDVINAGTGADSAFGGPGADTVRGEADNDLLLGNAGGGNMDDVGDFISGGAGNDVLDGWVGNDVLDGGPGNDNIQGNQDIDTVTYQSAPAGVTANLTANTAAGGAGNDTFVEFAGPIENLIGSNFNDFLVGDAGNNVIRGLNGNDLINGEGGNDALVGGNGNDVLAGRAGNDAFFGDAGNDTARFAASPAPVTVNLTAGTAAGEGADSLAGVENVVGSVFNDDLIGNGAGNVLDGHNGHDRVRGLANHDILLGSSGNDLMAGGDGNDQLVGAAGNDRLFGEAGVDSHNGGAGFDLCNGGLGLDFQVLCEVIVSIP